MTAAASNKEESQFGGKSHAQYGTAEKWGECGQVRHEARVGCDGWCKGQRSLVVEKVGGRGATGRVAHGAARQGRSKAHGRGMGLVDRSAREE